MQKLYSFFSEHSRVPTPPPPPPPPSLRWDQKVIVQLLQNMVMLHIKLKKASRMQQHGTKYFASLPLPPPHKKHSRGQKVKIQLFQNIVILHITSKGITNARTWTQIFCPQTPPPPPPDPGGKKVKIQLGHVAYQLKGNHRSKYFAADPPLHPARLRGQKVKIKLFQNMVLFHIKLKRITNAATW